MKTAKLTTKDVELIRKRQRTGGCLPKLVSGGLAVFILFILGMAYFKGLTINYTAMCVVVALGLVLMWLVRKRPGKVDKDLREKLKVAIVKTVTEKKLMTEGGDDAVDSVGCLTMDGSDDFIFVDRRMFDRIEIGDRIECYYAKNSRVKLGYKLVRTEEEF